MNVFSKISSYSRAELNLLANFAGTAWTAVMQLAFVPIYVKLMGIEAYGLVGFYVVLQAALQVLDLGLSPSMNREMARYSTQPQKVREARDLVRTLEISYCAIGLCICLGVLCIASQLATHWIKGDALAPTIVREAVMSMGVLCALQWPLSFYQAGLMGLQRQVLLNGVHMVMSTFVNVGAVLILWLISPNIITFFLWRIVMTAVEAGVTRMLLWNSLPSSVERPRFDSDIIRNIGRFAAGMTGIAVSALVLTQLDKVILSKLLTLEIFGYYTLAGVVVTGLAAIAGPIFKVAFPLFSSMVASGNTKMLSESYHRSTQLMAVLVLPTAALIGFFSYDLFRLWTGNAVTAQNAAPIATVLVIGSALNALMYVPVSLQLAQGWTSLGLRLNLFLILVLVPSLLVLAKHYGPVGAAAGWAISQAMYIVLGLPLTHRHLLKGEAWQWISQDVGPALAMGILVPLIARQLITPTLAPVTSAASIALVGLTTFAGAAIATPQTRYWLLTNLKGNKDSTVICINKL
jgi:O-antigen/teichoic acid export membrane protein